MSEVTFDYVVARPWHPEDPQSSLCIYAYGSQVKTGTMEDAEGFLEYVKFGARNEPEKQYSIYRIDFKKIDPISQS